MDLDQIVLRTEQFATRLEVAVPQVELGTVPTSCADGLLPRRRRRSSVLVVGDAFHDLPSTTQEGALVHNVAALGFHSAGRERFSRISGFVLGLSLVATVFTGLTGSAVVVEAAAFSALSVLLMLVAIGMWSRAMIFKADRSVTEVMGRPVMDVLFGLSSDKSHHSPLQRMLLGLFVPSRKQRLNRLDALVPSD